MGKEITFSTTIVWLLPWLISSITCLCKSSISMRMSPAISSMHYIIGTKFLWLTIRRANVFPWIIKCFKIILIVSIILHALFCMFNVVAICWSFLELGFVNTPTILRTCWFSKDKFCTCARNCLFSVCSCKIFSCSFVTSNPHPIFETFEVM